MLENMKMMLEKAEKGQYAVPHFNINNLEWTKYILEECQNNNSPVILGVSEGAVKYMGGFHTVYSLVNGLLIDLKITIPVVLHLDHGSCFEMCKCAIDADFTSVMIDASKYSLEDNINITKKVIAYAKSKEVTVEAEVGHIGEFENNLDLAYASVEDCVKFVRETNVEFLAPALGSVHGIYSGELNLDFKKMQEIKEKTKLHLVLHGGTGIPDNKIKRAIDCGICKININTELQLAWVQQVRDFLNKNQDIYDPRKIIKSGENSIKSVIKNKIFLLGSNNKA